ncbi:MAG: hypothetical protein ACQKBU_03250 [Verrucomicrobiales bacterium]
MRRALVTLGTAAILLAAPACAATDAEKVLLNRYLTQITFALRDAEGDQLSRLQQEAVLIGAIGFYYYKDSDPDFACNLRSLARGFFKQSKTTFAAEFPTFKANFAKPATEEAARQRLLFLGFDAETSKQVQSDARSDGMRAFSEWMQAPPKNKQ